MRALLLGLGLALAAPSLAAACPEITTGVTEITLSLADLGAPFAVPVIAGGDQDLAACGFPGGFVITQPDFSFNLTDISGPMPISVDSACDSVLLVNDPSGNWHFDDDSGGDLQAALLVDVTPGRLDVWVGTYDGVACEAVLILE